MSYFSDTAAWAYQLGLDSDQQKERQQMLDSVALLLVLKLFVLLEGLSVTDQQAKIVYTVFREGSWCLYRFSDPSPLVSCPSREARNAWVKLYRASGYTVVTSEVAT